MLIHLLLQYSRDAVQSRFERALLQHCFGCVAFLLLQKVVSASAMLLSLIHI